MGSWVPPSRYDRFRPAFFILSNLANCLSCQNSPYPVNIVENFESTRGKIRSTPLNVNFFSLKVQGVLFGRLSIALEMKKSETAT